MKGICGIVFKDQDRPVTRADLEPMAGSCDKWLAICDGPAGLAVTQGFSRFEGISEATADGKRLLLAFHGNVYNWAELAAPDKVACTSSRELLELYLAEGTEFLHKLRGDFCLALWDGRSNVFHLATDPFRVRALFYCEDAEKLIFGSRMKAILASPLTVGCTINPESIVDVVASSIIPTPKTIFREFKKLPPGHCLTYQNGMARLAPYWQINFLDQPNTDTLSLQRELKAKLSDAISVRLEGDGNSTGIGTFLSGGVDSSTVTGLLTQLAGRPVKSFSIGFGEAKFNEIDYARIAARAFGSEHFEYFVTPGDVYDAIPILMESFDEPFANASAVPTYFCAKLAKEHGIDTLYAGDGGDELFAGNQRYADQRLFDYYDEVPGWLRKQVVEPLVFLLADASSFRLLTMAKKYIQRASIPNPQRLTSYGFFKTFPMTELFTTDFLDSVGKDYDADSAFYRYYYEAPAKTELDRHLYIDLKLAISDNDLFKVSRMAEAAGATVRYPFLDHRLAEFACRVPAHIKMRGRKLRAFFKEAYSDLLPAATISKQKHGFGLPIPVWLRTDGRLNEMMHDLILSSQSVQRGYFEKSALEKLVDLHKSDNTSFYGTIIWNLIVLELWHRATPV